MSDISRVSFPPLFRLLLLIFPGAFRRMYSAELLATVAERRLDIRRAGILTILKFWLRESIALVREGLRVRLGGGKRHRQTDGREPDTHSFLGPALTGLATDVRYAVRKLASAPGFTLSAVLVLAFGIGANGAVFSALKTAVISKPPYPEPERLVIPSLVRTGPGVTRAVTSWSYPRYRFFEDYPDRLLEPVAAYTVSQMTLSGAGDPTQVNVELVTPDYFPLLGASTVFGRAFTVDEDDEQDPPLVAVMGYGLWRDRFGSDPEIIGRRIWIEGQALTVVGVLADGFAGVTGRGELWVPLAASGALLIQHRLDGVQWNWFYTIGRLAPGVSLEEARSQLTAIGAAFADAYPDNDGTTIAYEGRVQPLQSVAVNRTARLTILILSAAAATVLLIACANLAGLLLARAGARRRETAVRLAVGAGRWRIVRQLLVESLVLAFLGGGIGILVAYWGILGLQSVGTESLISGSARLQYLDLTHLSLDAGVVCFTIGLSALTSVLFGLVPALRLSRMDLLLSMKNDSSASGTKVHGGVVDIRSLLIVPQVAMAMVLLTGAGLMIASVAKLQGIDTGIDTENLLTFVYNLPRAQSAATGSGSEIDQAAFHDQYLTRLRSLPGVRAASLGCPPLAGTCVDTGIREIEGRPPFTREDRISVGADIVASGLFRTIGTPLVQGRDFGPIDGEGEPLVAIVNETAAQLLFPSEEALGQRIAVGFTPEGQTAEVVGVVGNVRYEAQEPREEPMVYLPMSQAAGPLKNLVLSSVSVLVRTNGDPHTLLPALRSQLSQMDPNIAIYSISTVEALGANAIGNNRMIMRLLTLFAVVAVALSAVGIYGVVAYAASLRNREIGLRMALGAQSGQVISLVLRRGVFMTAAGLAVGSCCAWGATRVLATLLFEISPTDPATFALGAAVLFVAAVLASFLPARRATRVDPMTVLRVE